MNASSYGTRTDLKALLGIASTDTADDSRLLAVLEAVTRWIDGWTGRHFQPRSETRYFSPTRKNYLLVDDLLSVTTLKTDEDDDYDYDYTWSGTVTTGDYLLEPFNEYPKTKIVVHPNGDYDFYPSQPRSVEIAGLWGYGNGESATPYEDSGTDTAEELDATETAVDVVSGAALAVGQTILVESEQMFITAIATNTLTVRRGVNGTTAATHATSKDIYIYRYPEPVREACLLQASRLFRRREAPFGVSGGPEFGQTAVLMRLDWDVRYNLEPFRRIGIA